MKTNQTAHPNILRKLGSLLLCGTMLITGLSALASCKGNGSGNTETTTQQTDAPAPEIDHLITTEDGIYSLVSPTGAVTLNLFTGGGNFYYNVNSTNDEGELTEWVRTSKIGVQLDRRIYYSGGATITDATLTEIDRTFPLLGNQSSVTDHCYELVLTIDQGGYVYYLDARAYDNGVAFRYRLPAEDGVSLRKISQDYTTYNLRTDLDECWYGVNNQDFEPVINSHEPTEVSEAQICMPLTAEVKNNGGYITIMEGALTDSFSGVNLKAMGDASYGSQLYDRHTGTEGDMISGWRMINIAENLNDLVNNYNVYCVNEPADETLYADTSWIEPGRSAWSWNVDKKAPTYEQMLEYTRMAAELGFEYNIVDEGWYSWSDYKTKLSDIGLLGDEMGVKQILWLGVTRGADRADATPNEERVDGIIELLQETHMDGIKMDFWWTEANPYTTELQKYTLEETAKHKFVVNFHGCNKNSGLNAAYPNEVTREAIRGHENIGNSDSKNYQTYADWLNAQLYTRFLCGHADWTPAVQSAMQIGSIICIDSPFMAISYEPAKILSSPAVEFIKSIPTTWDKTVVLPGSEIGAYSVYAKQKDGVWFVGGIASAGQNKAKVYLSDFITDGGTYLAEIVTGEGTGMKIEQISVTKDDVIDLGRLNGSEGFAIRLTKLSLSQYGGKVTGPITVTAPEGATVKYTTDGSDPRTSDTAVAAGASITLTESCRLKVAITDGDGKGTMLSYRFNIME